MPTAFTADVTTSVKVYTVNTPQPARHLLQRLALPNLSWASTAAIAAAILMMGFGVPITGPDTPTPEEYVDHVGGDAYLLAPGELKLDGQTQICGHRPTVIDSQLDDFGAAYPGFLILNPKLLKRVSTPVKLWIYAHECAHQFRGPDEEVADCFAVQRGRRQGWLTPEGLEEVCEFIRPSKGSMMHLSGSLRCEAMRKCYADDTIR